MFHDVIAIRDGRGAPEILFHQQNGKALLFERPDGLADLLNNDGGKSFGWLVEQQQPCARAKDAADRQHLLFTAREFGALAGTETFLEIGKQLEDAIEREPPGFTTGGSSRFSSTLRLEKTPRSSGQKATPAR